VSIIILKNAKNFLKLRIARFSTFPVSSLGSRYCLKRMAALFEMLFTQRIILTFSIGLKNLPYLNCSINFNLKDLLKRSKNDNKKSFSNSCKY
jgi:hypothetical protein